MKQEKKCTDKNCTVHKKLLTRGRSFVGTVISNKAQKTTIVEWQRKKYLPKFERYMLKRTRVAAHCPECITLEKGDKVKISECRPLSKTKKFVVVEKFGKDIAYLEKEQASDQDEITNVEEKNESIKE